MNRAFLLAGILVCVFSSCRRQRVCTEIYAFIIIETVDAAGNRVVPQDYSTKIKSTGADITDKSVSDLVLLTSDAHKDKFGKHPTELIFSATAGGVTLTREYEVKSDGCHVQLVSGDTRMVFP